ncbi:type IV pili twitching motility protein PilT [Candidatus Desantisbacteria bacterium CG_4_10_14_0_8_um_filter_48_22]|uniref:Type IV pili twitching motility protein PilT n=1 Tax=Candidatus Desantisbacteria bacterium CG_4_10_14_0_8_um_filter_48_22 TaxID=1974543 RepID=A0A2M7SE08_9BACT|nr:MAG: type IV pili twitching motility protein PilT [Candidatus Desantisbacteria bacterium CG1_02_49_89]PIV57465.1 MAG: type IV pili twitching motility protein PilT [Candidatus Desantisbacteria bacterium CG02_land_8_20_14_3_00_49_13]PIZ17752.1 MAG: type IV pili twitching motility protein PilT [Candidatus Desantisbacteria bacterium CG_4_10_14_0_8_um_filter_48_22]
MDINDILKESVRKGVSDIHLSAGMPAMVRLAGELIPMNETDLTTADAKNLAYSMMSTNQAKMFEENYSLDFSYGITEGRFRVNVFQELGGIAVALRPIPTKIPSMESLDMPKIAYDLARLPRGLVLVTGPTGSGKSTTLAAMIDLINSEKKCHIITVEDPIEFIYPKKKAVVHQRGLSVHMGSFAGAMKDALREDPDVLLVGEMRDLETIVAAITLAETGHLVFSTLHTIDAAQTVDRIIDVFPVGQQQQIRAQLSMALKGIISQQLLSRIGGGRVAAREIMLFTAAIANLIREGKTHQIPSAIQLGREQGMTTMEQSLKELHEKGLIDYEEAISRSSNPGLLKNMLHGK